jgi:hypothetical protein
MSAAWTIAPMAARVAARRTREVMVGVSTAAGPRREHGAVGLWMARVDVDGP